MARHDTAQTGDDRFAMSRNFLATDKVPDSIFGFEIVADKSKYTRADIEFFREHPEAGGYYDLGDGGEPTPEEPTPEEPTPEEPPEQGDLLGGVAKRFKETGEVLSDLYEMSGLKKRVGEAGEVADAGIAWMERTNARIADKDLPVLSQIHDAIVSPALVGTRAAVANVASDGGKAYTPEVRDASHFSQNQLLAIAKAAAGRKNGSGGRVEPGFDAGKFGASQALGGFSVKGDAVTDVFDVNSRYDVVPDAMSRFVGGIFGSDKDPDAGKVQTRIPLSALHQAAKGGQETSFDTPIPKELQARYDAWYAQLPKNLQYTGDYDLQGTWLEKLGQPDKYEASQNGHLDDYGKKPNHITFSTGSKWHDPKVPERTGGEWRRAEDGSWDFYPGPGNKASDDELRKYFDEYEKGNRVHKREVRQASGGGATFKKGPVHYGPPPPAKRGAYPGSLNNPGNVRWGDVSYPGMVTTGLKKQDFLKFSDALSGLNAMGQSVGQMARVKLAGKGHVFTLENLVRDAYARENENDTEGYIRDVSKFSGIDRSAVLDMSDSETMAKLLEAMVRRDSGHPHANWFTPGEYRTAAGWMTRKWENGQFTEDK